MTLEIGHFSFNFLFFFPRDESLGHSPAHTHINTGGSADKGELQWGAEDEHAEYQCGHKTRCSSGA